MGPGTGEPRMGHMSYKVGTANFINEKRKEKKRKSGQHAWKRERKERKEKNMRSREAKGRGHSAQYMYEKGTNKAKFPPHGFNDIIAL
jgi:hypothetical protein